MGVGGGKWAARLLAATLLLAPLPAAAAPAQDIRQDVPALINADEISYDENLGVVTASGHVEIAQEGRVVLADSVTVNLRTNVVTASGNVSLLEPSGEVIFADFVELTDDLREGFIRDIRVLLTDRSRLAAVSGLRTGGNKTVFRKGVFSPCELCREDPTRAPLWQLKAMEIEHDQEAKLIRYRDAWMEMFGVPVFYTPYFEHPDPTVKRKSGLLAPTFGNSDILGATYQQGYFWAIGPDRDATIAPILTTRQGVVLTGEYRELFPDGSIALRGSGTVTDRKNDDGTIDSDEFRGHVEGTGLFDIDETYRWGFDARRASDETYLRIYNLSSDAFLTSRAYLEGLSGRNYLSANAYSFQGLRATDDQDEAPIVLPLLDYNFISEPGVAGGTYSLDADLMVLSRIEGRDSRRLSTQVGWTLPYVGPAGDVYKVSATLRGDAYWTEGVDPFSDAVNPTGPAEGGLTGRIFPQLAVQWRYPWVRTSGGVHQIVEPMAQAVVAPNGSNPGQIPNEDSLDFEFDDTNLFSPNRFPGLDRVDPGTRFDYGLKWTVLGDGGGLTSVFAGQSYRIEQAGVFADGSGVEDNFSDIVGRLRVKPISEVDLLYRFRLDKDSLRDLRSELDLRVGPPALNLSLNYTSIATPSGRSEFPDREEVNYTLGSKLSQYWYAYGGQRIDFEAGETREIRAGLVYSDECFRIEGVANRTFFSDREIEPEDSFFVNVIFKNLGGFATTGAEAISR